jgi:RNA polymerase sigma-70 factor (ECF subfamily)
VAVTSAEAAAAVTVPTYPPDRFLPPDDPEWPGHWAHPPEVWPDVVRVGLPHSDAAVAEVRAAISDLPPVHRRVIVLRDIEGRTPAQLGDSLDLDVDRAGTILHQARAHVRRRLERFIAEHSDE